MAKHESKEQKRLHFSAMLGMVIGRAALYEKVHPEWTSEQIEDEILKREEDDDLTMWDYTSKYMKEAKAR